MLFQSSNRTMHIAFSASCPLFQYDPHSKRCRFTDHKTNYLYRQVDGAVRCELQVSAGKNYYTAPETQSYSNLQEFKYQQEHGMQLH